MSILVPAPPQTVRIHSGGDLASHFSRWVEYLCSRGLLAASRHPAWLNILRDGLGHEPYCLEVVQGTQTRGILPLAYVHSWIFGRFLVSLPYLNTAGIVADDENASRLLISEAVQLADKL